MDEKPNAKSANAVSIIVVVAFALVVALLLFRPVDIAPSITSLLQVLLGVLAAKFSTVVDYYLGSSADARRRDDRRPFPDGGPGEPHP